MSTRWITDTGPVASTANEGLASPQAGGWQRPTSTGSGASTTRAGQAQPNVSHGQDQNNTGWSASVPSGHPSSYPLPASGPNSLSPASAVNPAAMPLSHDSRNTMTSDVPQGGYRQSPPRAVTTDEEVYAGDEPTSGSSQGSKSSPRDAGFSRPQRQNTGWTPNAPQSRSPQESSSPAVAASSSGGANLGTSGWRSDSLYPEPRTPSSQNISQSSSSSQPKYSYVPDYGDSSDGWGVRKVTSRFSAPVQDQLSQDMERLRVKQASTWQAPPGMSASWITPASTNPVNDPVHSGDATGGRSSGSGPSQPPVAAERASTAQSAHWVTPATNNENSVTDGGRKTPSAAESTQSVVGWRAVTPKAAASQPSVPTTGPPSFISASAREKATSDQAASSSQQVSSGWTVPRAGAPLEQKPQGSIPKAEGVSASAQEASSSSQSQSDQIESAGWRAPSTPSVNLESETSIRPSESASNVGSRNGDSAGWRVRPSSSASQAQQSGPRKPFMAARDDEDGRAGGWQGSSNQPQQTVHDEWGKTSAASPAAAHPESAGWKPATSATHGTGPSRTPMTAPTPTRWEQSNGNHVVHGLEQAAVPVRAVEGSFRPEQPPHMMSARGSEPKSPPQSSPFSSGGISAPHAPPAAGRVVSIRGASQANAENQYLKEELAKMAAKVKVLVSELGVKAMESHLAIRMKRAEEEVKHLQAENAELRTRLDAMQEEKETLQLALRPVFALMNMQESTPLAHDTGSAKAEQTESQSASFQEIKKESISPQLAPESAAVGWQ